MILYTSVKLNKNCYILENDIGIKINYDVIMGLTLEWYYDIISLSLTQNVQELPIDITKNYEYSYSCIFLCFLPAI